MNSYSPYATQLATASNQQSYNSMGGAGTTRNNKYQSNNDYYDYYDYGGSSNQNQNNFSPQQNFQQRRLNNNRGGNAGGGNGGILGGLNRRMSQMKAAASGGHGSHSGGGEYCDNGISIGLLLTAALGIAVMFYTLYTKITMAGGRRRKKRSEVEENLLDVEAEIDPIKFSIDHITDFMYSGLEEFEDKVDKIASGQDDDSWIGQIYNTFSSNFGMDGSKVDDSELGPKEGLEPPILDETWGLEDVRKLHETDEEVPIEPRGSRSKRSDVDENNNENEIGDEPLVVKDDLMDSMMDSMFSGETKCKARFWKCLGMVAQSSLHYMNEPGGISSAVQKMMFRVAFHGGIGNFWKALMTIPEAREVKHCMNKQDDCMSFEVLRKEVETLGPDGQEFVSGMDETPDQTINKRLLINPEFVESMDTSDGSQQFSPEDQLIEDEFAKQD